MTISYQCWDSLCYNMLQWWLFSCIPTSFITNLAVRELPSDEPVAICQLPMGRGQCGCCAPVRNQNSREYPKGFPGGFMELEIPIPPYATNLKQGDDISYKGYLMIKNRDLMGYNADEWIIMDRYLKLVNISTAGPGGSKFTVITATLCMDIEPTVLELHAAGLRTTHDYGEYLPESNSWQN